MLRRLTIANQPDRTRLGDLLVARGRLAPAGLERALAEAAPGERLGEALVRLGLARRANDPADAAGTAGAAGRRGGRRRPANRSSSQRRHRRQDRAASAQPRPERSESLSSSRRRTADRRPVAIRPTRAGPPSRPSKPTTCAPRACATPCGGTRLWDDGTRWGHVQPPVHGGVRRPRVADSGNSAARPLRPAGRRRPCRIAPAFPDRGSRAWAGGGPRRRRA